MLKSEEFLKLNSSHGILEDKVDKTTASGCQPIGFDSTLNSRSAAPTPPRAIKLLSWKEVSFLVTVSGTSNQLFPLLK